MKKKRGRQPIHPQENAAHNWAAWLDAGGMKVTKIAQETGMSVQNIYRLRRTRLYMAVRAQYSEEILAEGAKASLAHIMADAPRNVEFLKDLRDGDLDDLDPQVARLRLDASKELLNIQHPKQQKISSDTTHRFVLEDTRRQKIANDCLEAGMPIIPLKKAIRDARESYVPEE